MLNQSAPLDLAFQALADPTRRAIVARLAEGPLSVMTLARPLGMSLPAVMQHIGILQESGLVTSEKVGRVRTCRLDPESLAAAERWIGAQRRAWTDRLDRLDAYLETLKTEDTDDRSA